MTELKSFVRAEARTLPVILLLDRSGSMNGERIDSLNQAIPAMIHDFADESGISAEIKVAIISFGGAAAKLECTLTSASEINYHPLGAGGMTPLGSALKKAKELIENREIVTSRSYRPMVILVSDGYPNDNWEQPFEEFISEGRTKKCERWALAIGQGCDMHMLQKFIGEGSERLFNAEDAGNIKQFFRLVTMTTVSKLKSKNPNASISMEQIKVNVINPSDDDLMSFLSGIIDEA